MSPQDKDRDGCQPVACGLGWDHHPPPPLQFRRLLGLNPAQMIFQQLKKLNELSDKLTTSSLGLESWLKGLGITGWLTELVKGVIILFIAFVAIVIVTPCLLQWL